MPMTTTSMLAFLSAGLAGAVDPTITLNNGVKMPLVGAGTWQYNSTTAYQSVIDAISLGYTHIDTANDYKNQDGVGKALARYNRTDYFLTTKIPGCTTPLLPKSCYKETKKQMDEDLQLLNVDYVDLMLVHFPPTIPPGCGRGNCKGIQEQWRAVEELYKANKTRAIGVSNYCQSCFECLKETLTVVPAVNQVQYHVGMGTDPIGLFSYCKELGVVMQAYSPLGNGSPELIHGNLTTSIGEKYNKSSVQVALKWIVQGGYPVLTKSTNPQYLKDDITLFDFTLSDDDMKALNEATKPSGKPSFLCSS